MRAVTAGLFHSVDGVVEDPHLWQFDAFDEVMGQEMGTFISRADTVVMGRVGYEQWADHWPKVGDDDGFGTFINAVPKLVASRTLTGDLAWQNASLVEGDLFDAVRALKQTEGGEIAVCGGITIVRELLFAGLLDRLTLMTHPVVAGSGRHLFEPGDPVTRLTLDRSLTTPKGNVVSDYSVSA
ncbi:dihydrofolate reductase family protein [Solicola sp. PLA-1-18]|uniref:dihydrofolate reductase family protein n=1 Tax=Solicola sp. PLA-1-18 TaxID=3380532 RepID=UPI003B76CD66